MRGCERLAEALWTLFGETYMTTGNVLPATTEPGVEKPIFDDPSITLSNSGVDKSIFYDPSITLSN